jgi:hypothetical protein
VADRIVESGGVVAVHVSLVSHLSWTFRLFSQSVKPDLDERELSSEPISYGSMVSLPMKPSLSCALCVLALLSALSNNTCTSSNWSGPNGRRSTK